MLQCTSFPRRSAVRLTLSSFLNMPVSPHIDLLGLHFPSYSCFNAEFMLSVLNGKKKLMTLEEFRKVSLPNYTITAMLAKESLLSHCSKHNQIRLYLPDSQNLKSVERDFLLSVSLSYLLFS
jgi:hypothetical protein